MTLFSDAHVRALAQEFSTPLWVYDAATVRERIQQLKSFDAIRFAQKACSNIHLLRLMKDAGVVVDAVSLGEIERAQRAGLTRTEDPLHAELVFTADLIDRPTLAKVVADRIPLNAGSIDMLHQLGAVAPGHPVWLRINPGFGHGHSNKTNTGGEHSKHGIWHTDLPQALDAIRQHGLKLIGLHMHIGSGVDYSHLARVCGAMVALVQSVHALGHDIQALSAGGGLSTPYTGQEPAVDTAHYYSLWDDARQKAAAIVQHPVKLEIEPGRFLVAESGILIAEVRAVKDMGANHFVLVDAGFNDLMRPALYGSHHELRVVACPERPATPLQATVVAGPLCESGDVFTQLEGGVVSQRQLPLARVGDLVVFRDTGAYGASMSSNYNTRPLIAEVLVDQGQARLIRRRQTIDELLALEAP